MGTAPNSDQPQAAASLPRELESQTEVISSYAAKPGPRRYFARVPTHAVGVASERRRYPRAALSLPLRLTRVGARNEPLAVVLVTRNISSSGVFFLAPREIEPGTAVDLQVALIERPLGFGSVQMNTAAHVVRSEKCAMPGWHGYAASFDDFALERDDMVPKRFSTA